MERYIDRMARIITDMTDLVRIEQDALALELTWIDIAQTLREIVDAYGPDAQLRRVSLTLEGGAAPVWVKADAQRLVQVLSNVLDNALKFTPADGIVLVSVIHKPMSLEVRVRDTGSGISEEMLPRVFDLYAGTTPPRGMGIGLTVARRIVQMHNGDIAIFSEGVHKGTEVVITLPVGSRFESSNHEPRTNISANGWTWPPVDGWAGNRSRPEAWSCERATSPVSRNDFKRLRSSRICCDGSSPKSEAIHAPSLPAGGSYCRWVHTSVPPYGVGLKCTEPAVATSDSPTDCHPINSFGISLMMCASQLTVIPAGPRAVQRERVRSSSSTCSRCVMNDGRFESCRQKR
jgi:anti-sigma regulatory factor (Ser/Thr protein kinase)